MWGIVVLVFDVAFVFEEEDDDENEDEQTVWNSRRRPLRFPGGAHQ